jgi:alanine dehydrogenase
MSQSPFSRKELLPQEEKLAVAYAASSLVIAFAKASSLQERRAPISPAGVAVLVSNNHHVMVESQLGDAAGYSDQLYAEAGAIITSDLKKLYAASVVVKVDPPSEEEIKRMNNGAVLVSALQIKTRKRSFFEQLLKKNITAIALEYIEDGHGGLPFVLIAAELLATSQKAKGILFGNISGVKPLSTVVIGASSTGVVAAKTAMALGSQVALFDLDVSKLRLARQHISANLSTQLIADTALAEALKEADVVIGALSGERRAPVVVSQSMVDQMQEGSVIIDISIDSGGCIETSELTTHDRPTSSYNGVVHYGVPNIPSRYPKSSTDALSALITPFVLKLSYEPQIESVLAKDATVASGVYCYKNKATKPALNDWFGFDFHDLKLYLL